MKGATQFVQVLYPMFAKAILYSSAFFLTAVKDSFDLHFLFGIMSRMSFHTATVLLIQSYLFDFYSM